MCKRKLDCFLESLCIPEKCTFSHCLSTEKNNDQHIRCSPSLRRELRWKQVRVLRGPATVTGEPCQRSMTIHWNTGKDDNGSEPKARRHAWNESPRDGRIAYGDAIFMCREYGLQYRKGAAVFWFLQRTFEFEQRQVLST